MNFSHKVWFITKFLFQYTFPIDLTPNGIPFELNTFLEEMSRQYGSERFKGGPESGPFLKVIERK